MYEIVWTSQAFNQMDQIIRNNPARKEELADGLRELAARLGSHANTAGESRGITLRVVFVGPLTVYFRLGDSGVAEVIRVKARFIV